VSRGYFVTGTDTGVGKTLVACALLHAFAAAGKTVAGMKPVAAGMEDGRYADVDALVGASNVKAPGSLVNPYAFEPPIAPHIAASEIDAHIDIDGIALAHQLLSRRAEVLIVEGAGGFMIPLNDSATSADLAQRLALPVILVVGMRLGCLNHALLTRDAILAKGLRLAGWVANAMLPPMARLEENIFSLAQRIEAPLLGVVPPLEDIGGWPAMVEQAAGFMDLGSLSADDSPGQ
jgi:dethiobiotin synthetase